MAEQHGTYQIKSGSRPVGNPSRYNYLMIQTLLEATDPEKVSTAGQAFNSAAAAAAHVARELYEAGKRLAQAWHGADADTAQTALGQLYATANELYWRCQQAGTALQTYGVALRPYKNLNWPSDGGYPALVAGPAKDEARQAAAEKVMQAVNQHIASAWDSMPDKVQMVLPDPGQHKGSPYDTGDPTSSRSPHPRTGTSGGGLDVSPQPKPSVGPAPISGSPGGADLAGLQPGGPGGLGPGLTSPGPGGIPGGFNPGTVGGPTGPLLPGAGRGPALGGQSAEQTSLRNALAAQERLKAAGAARNGLIGGPMGAGHPTETERERTTWLSEDEDVWTGGGEHTSHVIGDAPNRIGEHEERPAANLEDSEVLDPEELQRMLDALLEEPGGESAPDSGEQSIDDLISELSADDSSAEDWRLDG